MAEPIMRSPLHAFGLESQARAVDDSKGVWANEMPCLGYISLRGNSGDTAFVTVVSSTIGAPLPIQPCTLATSNGVKVLWLSPDEWMIVCERSQLGSLMGRLREALSDIRSQVVDNSGGYTQVILLGRNALDVLQHASVYDFAALDVGRVVGTTFGKSSVYAHRQGDGYCLLLRRSFADYIWRYLVRAALPYGLGVADFDGRGHAGQGAAA
jgi:sarcosine oxidase, subunit gamma